MKEIYLTLPKRWSNLTRDQLAGISRLLLKYREKPDFMVRCLLMFTGWKIVRWKMLTEKSGNYYFFKKKGIGEFCITGDVFTGMIKHIEWLLSDINITGFSPEVPGYEAPNFMLYGTTLNQYLMADNYYRQFIGNNDFHALSKMIVVLYCNGFEGIDIDRAALKLDKNDKSTCYAVFIWFSGAKNWIKMKYPNVFSHQGETGNYSDETILSLLSSLNGGDITRNKTILDTMVHEALFELNLKIETSQKK